MKTDDTLLLPGVAEALGDVPPARCPIRPSHEPRHLREHAGGLPDVALEFDEFGEIVGAQPVQDFDWNEIHRNVDGEVIDRGFSGIGVIVAWLDEMYVTGRGFPLKMDTSRKTKILLVRNYVEALGLTYEQIGNRVGLPRQHVHEIWQDFADRFQIVDKAVRTKSDLGERQEAAFNERENERVDAMNLTPEERAAWDAVKKELA